MITYGKVLFHFKQILSTSLRSRRLEVVGTRKNGRARRRHARGEGASPRKCMEISLGIGAWLKGLKINFAEVNFYNWCVNIWKVNFNNWKSLLKLVTCAIFLLFARNVYNFFRSCSYRSQSGVNKEHWVVSWCRGWVLSPNNVIQKIEKKLNNTHATTQKWTNNGFPNKNKQPKTTKFNYQKYNISDQRWSECSWTLMGL